MPALDRHDLVVLFGCAVYLYANLFASPGTPYLLGGDQVFFWMDAQRMLHGEQIYRDFFQKTPPGADLLYLGVFKLFGPRIWTTNLVVLLLGIALCLLCLRISRTILPRPESALATSLYLVFVIGLTLDGTHHWFSFLAVLGAAAVLMEGISSLRVALAGALLGLATFFTQTHGPVAALAIAAWISWEESRRDEPWPRYVRYQALLFATLILTWTALSGYYIATLGVQHLWFYQVAYVRHLVSGWNAASVGLPQGRSWSSLVTPVRWLFAYALLPSVYAISLWRCARISRDKFAATASRVALLTAIGAALWVEVALSPSWFRFFCVSMPGVILLIWLVTAAAPVSVYLTRSLWIGVIALAAYQTWSKHRISTAVAELPAGKIAMTPLAAERLGWLAAHTKPGDFMFQAEWPGMYLPLDLRNPVYIDVIDVLTSSPEYVALSIRQLQEKHVEFIVESPAYSLPAFRSFLMKRYRLVWRFSDGEEVWQRQTAVAAPAGQPL
jgi:hypothetical protein